MLRYAFETPDQTKPCHYGIRKKNIVTSVWEFTPQFTGGLGVPCYHIVKTLSTQANIHLIVPFAGAESNLENVGVVGLNELEQEFAGEPLGEEFKNFLLSRVPLELSAYPSFLLGNGGHQGMKAVKHCST